MKKIKIIKRAAKNPRVLKNNDAYDGVLINWDGTVYDGVVNTDPTNTYEYRGEIVSGEYIAKKKIRASGMVVWELETLEGSKIIPATQQNKKHGGKKQMVAVQIHVGGRTWDGSHGCITVHPDFWFRIRAGWDDVMKVEITEEKNT